MSRASLVARDTLPSEFRRRRSTFGENKIDRSIHYATGSHILELPLVLFSPRRGPPNPSIDIKNRRVKRPEPEGPPLVSWGLQVSARCAKHIVIASMETAYLGLESVFADSLAIVTRTGSIIGW